MSEPEKKSAKLPPKTALALLDTLEAEIDQDQVERQRVQREKRRALIEKHHVHAEAFAQMRRLKAMDPAERNAWLKHFLHYVEAFDLDKQAELFEPSPADQVQAMAQAGAREGLGLSRGST